MKDPIRIKLTNQEAAIIAELFSDGESKTLTELLDALPPLQRRRLSDKIREEIAHSELNIVSARGYLQSRSVLHVHE